MKILARIIDAIAKYNPNHRPAGSAAGGEFAPRQGGGAGESRRERGRRIYEESVRAAAEANARNTPHFEEPANSEAIGSVIRRPEFPKLSQQFIDDFDLDPGDLRQSPFKATLGVSHLDNLTGAHLDAYMRLVDGVKNLEHLPLKTVEFKNLQSVQHHVLWPVVDSYARSPHNLGSTDDAGSFNDRPLVVRVHGQEWIVDGHHRLSGHYLRGHDSMEVRYANIDAAVKGVHKGLAVVLELVEKFNANHDARGRFAAVGGHILPKFADRAHFESWAKQRGVGEFDINSPTSRYFGATTHRHIQALLRTGDISHDQIERDTTWDITRAPKVKHGEIVSHAIAEAQATAHATIPHIDEAFHASKFAVTKQTPLYRIVSGEFAAQLHVGGSFSDNGYTSTTVLAHTLNAQARRIGLATGDPGARMRIHVAEPTKVLLNPHEAEVLLPRGMVFHVTSRVKNRLVVTAYTPDHHIAKARRKYPKGTAGGKGGQWMPKDGTGLTADAAGVWRHSKTGVEASAAHVARLKEIGASRGYKDIKLNPDPDHYLQAVGKDSKGRRKTWYKPSFLEANKETKYLRLEQFHKARPRILEAIDHVLSTEKAGTPMHEAALALKLIDRTGFRPGSDKDTLAEKKAYGATNMQARHVKVTGDTMTFAFTGKKGVSIKKTLEDRELAALIGPRVKKGGRLFDTDGGKLKDFLVAHGYGDFMPKDFRTWNGTNLALKLVHEMPKPKTDTAFKAAQKKVAVAVSQHLGNTPAIALASYINPKVWHHWLPVRKAS